MNSYEERQQERKERYLQLAEQAERESSAVWSEAQRMADAIPMGQPILVGHHSERADRAFRGRIDAKQHKAFDLSSKAAYYRDKAESVGTGGISGLDPDAVAKLEKELEKRIKAQEEMKAANRAVKMKDIEKGNAKLREMGYTDSNISELRKPDFCGRIGYPDYALQNNNASIRRIKERIAELKAQAENEMPEKENELYRFFQADGRYQFVFDGKPADEVRAILKGNGFKWSPSRGAWVRQVTANARYSAKRVMQELDKHI